MNHVHSDTSIDRHSQGLVHLEESTASGWERSLYAFLAEKHRRSGSQRTVQAYSRMLQEFFGRAG